MLHNWFIHTNELTPQNLCFKVLMSPKQQYTVYLGANQASKSEVCQSLVEKAKKADKEDGRG